MCKWTEMIESGLGTNKHLKIPKKKKDIPYAIASGLRCLDIGRDRVGARIIQPMGIATSVTTLLKVFTPNLTIVQGINFLVTLVALVIIFYLVSGYFYQKKMLRLENSFDFDRVPQYKIMIEKLNLIEQILKEQK